MKKTVNATIIFWWAFCERIHTIKSFSVCIINAIHEEVEQKIIILHWLLNSEYDYDSKLILNFLNSKNIELIFKNMIFYKTWYYCHLQSNLYTWEQWEIYCISNIIKIVWTINDIVRGESSYYDTELLYHRHSSVRPCSSIRPRPRSCPRFGSRPDNAF